MEDTVVKTFWNVVHRYADSVALMSKTAGGEWTSLTFREFGSLFERFGAGLLDFGVRRGDHVGIISDNRKEWMIANLGILGIGAADVPRGADTMPDETQYILAHADCATALAEDTEQLKKILSKKQDLPLLKSIIVIDDEFRPEAFPESVCGARVIPFRDIMARGSKLLTSDPQAFVREMDKGTPEDLATIIYTSGTTGEPKGVMLTHANFLHNIRTIPRVLDIGPGDVFLSILPVWHSLERIIDNFALSQGTTLAYSKPVTKIFLADMAAVRPTVMASVPRLWDVVRSAVYRAVNEEGGIKKVLFHFFVAVGKAHATASALVSGRYPQFTRRSTVLDFIVGILPFVLLFPLKALGDLLAFKKIKQRLGGRFRFTVSGGGALPRYVDRFFQAVGVLLLEGYGLTETTPVVSVQHLKRPVPGTIGPLLDELEVKLLDPDSGAQVGPGKKGVLHVRGPNVMKGYYKRPDWTAEVLSPDGWLNTGDLGMITWQGELKIIGRTKATIVLLGGENVEPVPIEDTILESKYVDQVMIVGQDQKFLAALVVPNDEALERYAEDREISWLSKADLLENPQIQELISGEINSRVCAKRGFREFERVFRFKLLPKHFEFGVELSGKQEVKRHVVSEMYRKEIASLFAK
ncbi:MAG TPA: long-chain fatty acid--CoA ligase [Spirochaetia bacterium]|nr:long-chain fatty acid--CoA ligase [Spirochaetia bacterium]